MRKIKKSLVVLNALVLTGLHAQSQEEFPPPPPDFGDFDTPTAPSPPSATALGSSPNSNTPGSNTTGKKGTSLTKNQKQKFSQANVEDISPENFPETIESFDFPNVEITDVIKAISELTGKNFIIDPGVRGKITIIAPSKITVAEAYKAFLSALAINGFTVVPSGSFLKVKSGRNAQRDNIETYSGTYYPNTDQMITRIIHLKHISAEQVNRDLRILPSKDGEMNVYQQTNSIIISDWGANIDRVMKIINQLDVPGFDEQLEVVRIRYAKAKDIADLVDKIVNKGQRSTGGAAGVTGGFGGGAPRFSRPGGSANQQGNSFFMAIPDDRTNSLIIVGNKSGIVRVKKLIGQLDFRQSAEDGGGVFVYYVKHGEAKKIAQVLQGVAKDAAPKPAASGQPAPFFPPPMGMDNSSEKSSGAVFGGEVKITADESTNSLIITAGKGDYDTVMSLLSKIDIARDQVFVEAIIMEMSAGDGFGFKPSYYNFVSKNGIARQSFSGGLSAEQVINPLAGVGTVLGFGSGEEVELQVGSTKQKVPSLVGLINLLKKTTKANILSRPQILAMDNQEALIQVGDKVVTSANTTANQGVTVTSPVFEEALIELKLKPFINPTSKAVRMEIDQSVKQPSAGASTPKAFQDNTQPLATRKIKTFIVVNDGDTAVLGGLIKDRETEEIVKVPLLGDLPILGWLFKSKETNKEKVNMLVFLTPKIIRTEGDSKQIISKRLDQRIDFIKAQGGVDPYGGVIDEIQKRTSLVPKTNEPVDDNPPDSENVTE
ncbi:MAG: type II secretion system secretin GspD [Bdellovibrionaceae bacterium]|nr:type II secretion system secretin GspD [Pseudobdellovibrionaceae bacterium]